MQRYRFLTIDQFVRIASLNRSTASGQLRFLERQGFLHHFGNQALRAGQEAVSQPNTHSSLERSLIHLAQVKDGHVLHCMLLRPTPIVCPCRS
jgi:hypothetical protein